MYARYVVESEYPMPQQIIILQYLTSNTEIDTQSFAIFCFP